MMVLLLTIACIAVAMTAMALGGILAGKRLRGSCGGVGNENCACERDGVARPSSCPRRQALPAQSQPLTTVRRRRG